MNKTFLFLGFILISFFSQAQEMGNKNYAMGNQGYNNQGYDYTFSPRPIREAHFSNDSTLIVDVNAIMNLKADKYVMILSLSQKAETSKECYDLVQERISNFKERLISVGFAEENIVEDFIAQVPVYEYEISKKLFSKTANEVPVGFELKKNLHILYYDPKNVDLIISIAAEFDIYDLVKVDYIIDDIAVVYEELRSVATKSIQKKIEQYAVLGIDVSAENTSYITFAEEWESFYPSESYGSYTAYNPAIIEGDFKNKTTIAKDPTFYYNPMNYQLYDVVINPTIVAPVVQISYNLKVKYSLKKR